MYTHTQLWFLWGLDGRSVAVSSVSGLGGPGDLVECPDAKFGVQDFP